MEDITKQPYAEWLEDILKLLVERKPTSICVMGIGEDRGVVKGYWNTSESDKAIYGWTIQQDLTMGAIRANIKEIKRMLDQLPDV